MLTSIRQVNEQFFRKFFGLTIPIGGVDKKILCRYARKSSYDYTEEQSQQIYPCIAIQDYVPIPKEEWYIDMHAYFGGKTLDGLKGYLFFRPIWMKFRYDVSIVSKSYNEYMAMQDFFMRNFVYGKRFIFNQYFLGEEAVGDIVPYSVRATDVPRVDGVFETNYEFTCSVWLYPRKPEEITLVQQIVIRMERNDKVLVNNETLESFEDDTKVVPIYGDTAVQEYPAKGKVIIIKYVNKGKADYTVTFDGDYHTPEGSNPSFTLPEGGYAEVSYSNTSGGIVYIRGVVTDKDGQKREIILTQVDDVWILEDAIWDDNEIWDDESGWKDSPDD